LSDPPAGETLLQPPRRETAPAGSLDDPAAYRSFVQSLFGPIEKKLTAELSIPLQVEIARLTGLLSAMPRKTVEANRELFELAYGLAAADRPNLVLLQSLVSDLFAIHMREAGGLSRLIFRVCGTTVLNALLSALLTIVVMSFAVALIMAGSAELLRHLTRGAPEGTGLFSIVHGAAFTQLLLMTHAAFYGSLVSIALRINAFLAEATMTPFMIYVAVAARPLVSVLIAMLVFAVLKSGLISFQALDVDGPNGLYLAWAIGFLCGFSERLGQHFIVDASAALGDSPAALARPAARPSGNGS
jgi:hypothetical protein